MLEKLRGSSIIEEYENKTLLRGRIRELTETGIEGVANKLVIFIDELDRCRPDFAVRLLEQTKRLFNSDRVILVFATDSRRLADAVGGMYGAGFESERFLERFFDNRLRLSPVDAFLVAASRPLDLTYRFDSLFQEVALKEQLTTRDMCHILSKFDDAKTYCSQPYGWNNDIVMPARCATLPLLVVLERINPELFTQIVTGNDPDALYGYGKQFDRFNSILGAIPRTSGARAETPELRERSNQLFMRSLCTFIYGDPEVENIYEAGEAIGVSDRSCFNEKVFKRLIFDDVLH